MFSRQNTLVSPLQITWIGVSMSLKSPPKQLRHLVSFAGIWLLHLGVQRKLHTKLWFGLNYSMQHPFGALTRNFRLIRLRKFRGQQPAGPAGDGETPVVIRWLLYPEARLARLVEHLTCKQKVVGSNPTLGRYFSTQVYLNGDEEIWSQVFGGFRGS